MALLSDGFQQVRVSDDRELQQPPAYRRPKGTASMFEYREFAPPAAIEPWVVCAWRIRGAAPTRCLQRVLPDGCADVLLDLHAARGHGAAAALVGPMSTAIVAPLAGVTDLIGVRLKPWACGAVTGVPASALRDLQVPLQDLAGTLPLSLSLAELAEPQRSDPLTRVWAALRVALRDRARPDALVMRAAARLRPTADGRVEHVSAVARALGVSERALERRFGAALGMSPAAVRRLQRFQAVLRQHARGAHDWAALAAWLGYSDQAHLSRDFKSLAGITPTAWAFEHDSRDGFVQDAGITAF